MGEDSYAGAVRELIGDTAASFAQDGYSVLGPVDSFDGSGGPMVVAQRGGEVAFAPITFTSGGRFLPGPVTLANRFAWRACARSLLRDMGMGAARVSFCNVSARRLSGADMLVRRRWR